MGCAPPRTIPSCGENICARDGRVSWLGPGSSLTRQFISSGLANGSKTDPASFPLTWSGDQRPRPVVQPVRGLSCHPPKVRQAYGPWTPALRPLPLTTHNPGAGSGRTGDGAGRTLACRTPHSGHLIPATGVHRGSKYWIWASSHGPRMRIQISRVGPSRCQRG